MIPPDAYLLMITIFFFTAAAGYLFYRIKTKNIQLLIPVAIYLSCIALFFLSMLANMLTGISVLMFVAALFVVFGAASIARFPLKLITPPNERRIFFGLVGVAVLMLVYSYFFNKDIVLKLAHAYAFVVAGLFTMGYIIYSGIRSRNKTVKVKSVCTGTSLGLCCVAAHGIAAFQILPLVGLSFFGIFTVKLPMIFAILSPITFIFVLYFSEKFGHRGEASG